MALSKIEADSLDTTLDLSGKTLTLAEKFSSQNETAVSCSGATSAEWTGLPDYINTVIVSYYDLSVGTNNEYPIIKLGDSTTDGYVTGAYNFSHGYFGDSAQDINNYTTKNGFYLPIWNGNSEDFFGIATCTRVNQSNYWVFQQFLRTDNSPSNFITTIGHVNIGGTLDRVKVECSAGTFDSGYANIQYW